MADGAQTQRRPGHGRYRDWTPTAHYLRINGDKRTWADAKRECERVGANETRTRQPPRGKEVTLVGPAKSVRMALAVIRNEQESEQASLACHSGNEGCWIGLHGEMANNTWCVRGESPLRTVAHGAWRVAHCCTGSWRIVAWAAQRSRGLVALAFAGATRLRTLTSRGVLATGHGSTERQSSTAIGTTDGPIGTVWPNREGTRDTQRASLRASRASAVSPCGDKPNRLGMTTSAKELFQTVSLSCVRGLLVRGLLDLSQR